MNRYLQRTLLSPRWRWLNSLIGPFVFSGHAHDQWLRVEMNRQTERLIHDLEPHTRTCLEISGQYWDRPNFFKSYTHTTLADYDVCGEPFPGRYDVIIAEQVFEHLLRPYRAGRNVFDMLNPGGYFLITTPFLVKVHNHPVDCSRWTELGLTYFLDECGFPLKDTVTGSWGNRACVNANFGPRWQIYVPWLHSLKNDPELPVSVWALARKPA